MTGISTWSRRCVRALGVVLALAASPSGYGAAAEALRFDTFGGDTWSQELRLEGDVLGQCDQVELHSPVERAIAWTDGKRFSGEVELLEGGNRVYAVCLDDGQEAGRSAEQQWVLRAQEKPEAWVRVTTDEQSIRLDAGRSSPASGRPAPIVSYRWNARDGNPAPLVGLPAETEVVELAVPERDGEYYVELLISDALGRSSRAAGVFRVNEGRATEVDLMRDHPAWVDEAVLYGVAPFFFGNGDYNSIAARLDAIAALGVTAIWLSPVTAAPADDFGYAVSDHFALRASFGTEEEFRQLVDAAHARDLKVLIDFVPNHFGDRHPYYRSAHEQGGRSPYYDWFERGPKGEISSYFDWDHLKNLDYDNPEVQRYIAAAFKRWVLDYGIDGFRVDASWAVRQRAPEFWPALRAELKRLEPDVFLLAEASARDDYQFEHGFDAAYDWTDELGVWAWDKVFQNGKADLARLREALTNQGRGYPDDALILRFLNNNDTGARFISRHGPGLTHVAATLLFTLPGIQLIYNGDEVGAEFEPYDEGPPIEWRDPHGLTPHYSRLSGLRQSYAALSSRAFALVPNDRQDAVLSYRRGADANETPLLVVLNFGADAVDVRLDPRAVRDARRYRDLLTGREYLLESTESRISLQGHQGLVLEPLH